MYILFCFNALHQLPLGRDFDKLPQHVSSYSSIYYLTMGLLWRINSSLYNGCVEISAGLIADSIGRMDIVELDTYEEKWW